MARDRTARTRIRNYLVSHGPVDDPSGHATSVLKDLVAYEGSAVAFIQLIAAMDRDDEIVRDIRGKRTYRIAATRAAQRAAGMRPGPAGPRALTVPLAQATAEDEDAVRIDYDKLARALVRQLWDFAASAAAEAVPPAEPAAAEPVPAAETESHDEIAADIEALRAERDRMLEERNEYAKRLRLARVQLDELLGASDQEEHEIRA